MKPDFSHASETFKRLNPHLFGAVGGLGATKRECHTPQALDGCSPPCQASPQSLVVCIVGFRRRILDDDNFCAGCKPLRDAIAFSLGRDDGDPSLTWEYAQVRTEGRQGVAVAISVKPTKQKRHNENQTDVHGRTPGHQGC